MLLKLVAFHVQRLREQLFLLEIVYHFFCFGRIVKDSSKLITDLCSLDLC